MTDLLIDTRPPDTTTPEPAAPAEPAEPFDWVTGPPPQSRLAALLHLEVRHDDGAACYRQLALRSVLAAAPLGVGGTLAHAAGKHWRHGGLAEALARWSHVDVRLGLLWTLAVLILFVGATFAWHWLWHRDEAPYAYNELLPIDTTVAAPPAGGPR